MDKINWKVKLASRKFWASLAACITTVLTAFNIDTLTIEQVGLIVAGIGTLAIYVLAEGYVDAKRVELGGAQTKKEE